MNLKKIKNAVQEAQRFLAAAEVFEKAEKERGSNYYSMPKETGAVRRASMDLTRALAEMRKPQQ